MLAYLDNAATAPLRPEAASVLEEAACGGTFFGNPSGSHGLARRAKYALEEARETMAMVLGARPDEIVFTSGGTESDNLAIAGTVASRDGGVDSVGALLGGSGGTDLGRGDSNGSVPVCIATEHHAVLRTCEKLGGRVVAVRSDGSVDLGMLESALGPEVAVVSVMLANNETGVVADLVPVARILRKKSPNAVLHTDAVQAFSWLDVARLAEPAGMVSLSGHKFGGPPGVGVLMVRGGLDISPIVFGGGQEAGRRSGTQNVAGAVAMAAAARATVENRGGEVLRIGQLRDYLADELLSRIDGAIETISRKDKIAGIAHMRFPGVENEELLMLLDEAGVCASAGSACSSGAIEPSHVLTAMGVAPGEARSAVRFSLGWSTTAEEVEYAVETIVGAVSRLRHATIAGSDATAAGSATTVTRLVARS